MLLLQTLSGGNPNAAKIVYCSHQRDAQERQYLEEFFRLVRALPLSQTVLYQAVALRQQRRRSRGEALLADMVLLLSQPLLVKMP